MLDYLIRPETVAASTGSHRDPTGSEALVYDLIRGDRVYPVAGVFYVIPLEGELIAHTSSKIYVSTSKATWAEQT